MSTLGLTTTHKTATDIANSSGNSTPRRLRVAIASDLHAYDRTSFGIGTPPSHFDISAPETPIGTHPIASLLSLIDSKALRADVLLCPGDLGDRAHPTALQRAWDSVGRIGNALQCSILVATAGNHDVDSRHSHNGFDARGMLQALSPLFPVNDDGHFDRFWSRHFTVMDLEDARLLVLNSSAYHGENGTGTNPPEYSHGRVAARTLDAIKQRLETLPYCSVNLLMCHHHPIPHDDSPMHLADIMEGGAELIQMLESGRYGNWVIIHGHKHLPRILYAQGGATAPLVFAAGSLCALSTGRAGHMARNQFYIFEFPIDECSSGSLVGEYFAWDWGYGDGWKPAQRESGLPHRGGFGNRSHPTPLANAINTAFARVHSVAWADVILRFPDIRYLLPRDLDLLLDHLASVNFHALRDHDDIVRLERRTQQ